MKKTFYLNVHQMQSEHGNAKMSTLFSRIDQHFIAKHFERKDLMRIYKDIPLSLDSLYSDHDYVKRQHGHDVQVHLDSQQFGQSLAMNPASKKKRRQIQVVKDSFLQSEESMFQQLQGIFSELQKKDASKTMLELTEILMRVSGDVG